MRRALIAALAALAPACTPVQFDGQELELTYLQTEGEPDALELSLRYRGLRCPVTLNDNGMAQAVAWTRSLERRERVFILQGWPLDFDLEADDDGEEPTTIETLLRSSVRVTHAELYLDLDGRLCADQRLRWNNVQASLTELNREWNATLAIEFAKDVKVELDAASLDILKEHVAAGRPWLQLDSKRLRFTLPMTEQALADLSDRKDQPVKDQLEGLRADLGADLVTSDEHGLHADWQFDGNGTLRLVDEVDEEPGSFDLRDRLRETGSTFKTREW